MPIRSLEHQLEDYSITQFRQKLPESWIFRIIPKDYGIDIQVEIVDANNKVTGAVFLVQLKATDSVAKNRKGSISMDIETLLYYKELQLPIMLVRYSKKDDQFFFKWVNNVDLFKSKKNAKTKKITFEDQDIWDDNTVGKIEGHLKKFRILKAGLIQLPVSISIVLKEQLLKTEHLIIAEARIAKELIPYKGFVTIADTINDSLFSIEIKKNEININASNIYSCVFHDSFLGEIKYFPENIKDYTLLGIANILMCFGQGEQGSKILVEGKLLSKIVSNREAALFFLPFILKSSFVKELCQFIEDLPGDDSPLPLTALSQIALLSRSKEPHIGSIIESILKQRLEKAIVTNNSKSIAISYYNLANHYRGQNRILDSVNNYQKARKSGELYLKQPYFFGEIAGLFFLQERFTISASLYKKSLEIERKTNTLPLYADALFFSGRYADALFVFSEYLNKTTEPKDEFILKAYVLEILLKDGKPAYQNRKIKAAIQLAGTESPVISIAGLQNVLQLDLLCGLAWFNLGISYYAANNIAEAAFAFLVCGLVQTWDIQAWVLASMSRISSGTPDKLLIPIIRVAYFFNKGDYLLQLLEEYAKFSPSGENLKSMKEFVFAITKDLQNTEPPVEYRTLNSNGRFDNILS